MFPVNCVLWICIYILFLNSLVEINLGDCLLKSGGAILLGEALLDGHEQLEVSYF